MGPTTNRPSGLMAPFAKVVPMLEIEVSKELFDKLRNMREDDFSRYLYEKVAEFRRYLELNDEEALKKKKDEIEKKIKRMKDEINELTEFCERAQRDQERMSQWIDELELENKSLLMEMRGNGSYVESRQIEKEKV